jgi:hypothetical protein
MARKEIDFTISEGTAETNRDFGKTFHIREMGAKPAEEWAMQALMIAAKNGVDIGEAEGRGMAGIAILGAAALLKGNFYEIKPLLDEMMTCVSIKPDPRNPQIQRPLIDDDIEEIATRINLRREVLNLHVNFSTAAAPSSVTSTNSMANS